MIAKYYWLTKPGIIYGNLLTASAGFFLASKGVVDWSLFFATLPGISLVIASACVMNNILDRDIDAKMDRTKHRSIVTGEISRSRAFIFGVILGILGLIIIARFTNAYVVGILILAWVSYVGVYTILKPKTHYATLIGTIPGASPLVAGYLAVSERIDAGAVILFLILLAWQMAHFYSIAIYRLDEYALARIPILPIKKGIIFTKYSIIGYTVLFIILSSLLTLYHYTGYLYLLIMLVVGSIWLWHGVKGLRTHSDKEWAKKTFKFSLVVLTVFSVTLSIGGII